MKRLLSIALLAASVALAAPPAAAQDCMSLELLSDVLKGVDGEIVAAATYPGTYADLTVIYIAQGRVLMVSFAGGCAVTPPLMLDQVATPPPKPKPPDLQS